MLVTRLHHKEEILPTIIIGECVISFKYNEIGSNRDVYVCVGSTTTKYDDILSIELCEGKTTISCDIVNTYTIESPPEPPEASPNSDTTTPYDV